MLTVDSFWGDFSNLLQSPQLAEKDFLLAYSGGCDSHVLLHLLAELKRLKHITKLRVVHINHQIHNDSVQWAEHCIAQSKLHDTQCEVISVNVNEALGLGIEAAARNARYDALKPLVTEKTVLLTAQHSDDQVETFLLQSMRGSGLKGLASMPYMKPFSKGVLLRPLLHTSQQKIQEYAVSHKLDWIEDSSNDNTQFDRNFLRKNVIPVLKQRWPSLTKTFHRLTQHQAEAACLLDELAEIDFENVKCEESLVDVEKFNQLSLHRQKNILRYWIATKNALTMPDATHLMRIINEVVSAAEDAQPSVEWADTIIRRYQGKLFADKKHIDESLDIISNWNPDKTYTISDTNSTNNQQQYLKCDQTEGKGLSVKQLTNKDVSIRFREGGEVCCPVGRGPKHHKLKKLMQEWNIPPWERNRIPLVYVDGILAQVTGYCTCESFTAQAGETGYDIRIA